MSDPVFDISVSCPDCGELWDLCCCDGDDWCDFCTGDGCPECEDPIMEDEDEDEILAANARVTDSAKEAAGQLSILEST